MNEDFIEEAFPFHMILGKSLELIYASKRLKRLLPDLRLDANVNEFIYNSDDDDKLEYENIASNLSKKHSFRVKSAPKLYMHGGFYLTATNDLLMVISPVVNSMENITQFDLKFDDFARHDPILSHIFVVQAKDSAAKDVRALVGNLERRIEERTRELSISMREAEEANRAKSEFLSRMSHELKTPMNAIYGFGQLIKYLPENSADDIQLYSDQILTSSEHLLGLVDEILDITMVESGKLKMCSVPIDAKVFLDECIALIQTSAADRGITVERPYLDKPDISFESDSKRLKQAIINLLSNAVKYNKTNGRIRMDCRPVAEGMLRFEIEDQGQGISAERQDEVFEPFNRLGHESGEIPGTGIGLTVTKKLVEALGGRIGFLRNPRAGTTFWIEIPMHPGTSMPEQRASA